MTYLRFTTADVNYKFEDESHTWSLPLNLNHKRVGLSSFILEVGTDPSAYVYEHLHTITLKCNLVEKTMANQNGILDVIQLPLTSEFQSYSRTPKQIGRQSKHCNICLTIFRNVEYWSGTLQYCLAGFRYWVQYDQVFKFRSSI